MTNELKVIHEQEVLGQGFKIYGSKEKPLFLAKDVKEWIEHNNTTLMLNNVDEDEKLTYVIHNSGQKREMWFLTEDGLYEVLMQSRKLIAKEFKKKVKEILKDIRNHGMYMNDNLLEKTLADPMFMVGLLTNYNDKQYRIYRKQ
ncbi:BRO family protein [Bacillus sp. FDAARGOS_235]|uniref:BRO-N domain-containing protein n=1 Tax=Bacillus sp. FDAARGOS_235 TaxID=1839798 RepID=UPI0011A44BB5|nr:BRO family protein [Bacillus sp. FDAARGOS_235]